MYITDELVITLLNRVNVNPTSLLTVFWGDGLRDYGHCHSILPLALKILHIDLVLSSSKPQYWLIVNNVQSKLPTTVMWLLDGQLWFSCPVLHSYYLYYLIVWHITVCPSFSFVKDISPIFDEVSSALSGEIFLEKIKELQLNVLKP